MPDSSIEQPSGWKMTIEADSALGLGKTIVAAIADKTVALQAFLDAEPLRRGNVEPLSAGEIASLGLLPGEISLVITAASTVDQDGSGL